MSATTILEWRGAALAVVDSCASAEPRLLAADSWLVDEGRMLASELHRARFADACDAAGADPGEVARFWDAAIGSIPRDGAWFPRVELRRIGERRELRLLVREAPERRRSVRLATHRGPDPRTTPRIKGPDLEALLRARGEAQGRGADEAVILSPEGYVVDGSTSCLVWWQGDALTTPHPDLPRVDSVTARSLVVLATALGVEVLEQHATPPELDGLEVWAVNALHGIRIVTEWIDGPRTAEDPGRLQSWRDRLEALRRPLPEEGAP